MPASERTKSPTNITALIQGVGEGNNVPNTEVLSQHKKAGSTTDTLHQWLSSAFSFVVPVARSEKK
jgi:hypothetical protein